MQTDCAQIFFPSDLIGKEGHLIGFNTRGFCFTVIWIEDEKTQTQIEDELNNWDKQNHIQHICGTKLQILGQIGKKHQYNERETYLQMAIVDQQLQLDVLMICGYKYTTKCTIIMYDKPTKNQLLTFQDETESFLDAKLKSPITLNQLVYFQHPIEGLKLQDNLNDMNELEHSLVHINCRQQILKEYFSIQKEIVHSDNYYQTFLKNQSLKPIIEIIIKLAQFQIIVFKCVLQIMDFQIFGKSLSNLGVLNHTLKQVKFKYKLLSKWNVQAAELLSKHQPINISNIINCYHKLFSGMLFFIMDMYFGVLSLLILYYNVSQLREFIHKYGSSIHIEVLSREVEWLMGFPAGLKTNKPLNSVLGQMIMYIIIYWNHITTFVTPYENILLRTIMVFGLFGLTFEIALTIDIISLCTIHVNYIYKMLAFTYRQLWHITIACYRITKDKYFNQMRKKIEEFQFSWERKMFGMFLGFFLLMMIPTVSLYYFWFLVIVIFIYLVKCALIVFSKLFSRFPLFLLYSYKRLNLIPKMIDLTVLSISKSTVLIKLNYKPVPITSIIKIEKLLKIEQNVKLSELIRQIFVGEDILIKNKYQKEPQQIVFQNMNQLLQI